MDAKGCPIKAVWTYGFCVLPENHSSLHQTFDGREFTAQALTDEQEYDLAEYIMGAQTDYTPSAKQAAQFLQSTFNLHLTPYEVREYARYLKNTHQLLGPLPRL